MQVALLGTFTGSLARKAGTTKGRKTCGVREWRGVVSFPNDIIFLISRRLSVAESGHRVHSIRWVQVGNYNSHKRNGQKEGTLPRGHENLEVAVFSTAIHGHSAWMQRKSLARPRHLRETSSVELWRRDGRIACRNNRMVWAGHSTRAAGFVGVGDMNTCLTLSHPERGLTSSPCYSSHYWQTTEKAKNRHSAFQNFSKAFLKT